MLLSAVRVFIDHSSVEIFINGGEETFTTHLYPVTGEDRYSCTGAEAIRIWPLRGSVKDDFVV